MNDFSKLDFQSISFPEAISFTQSLMSKIVENPIEEADLERIIAALVSTKNGARGFFVAYLTGDYALADSPSLGVVTALQKSPEIVSELLVKNLAMSSAMAITHLRNRDRDNASSSQTVCRLTANLIELMDLDLVKSGLKELKTTIDSGDGEYRDFLARWGYDREQQIAIASSIEPLIRDRA